MIPTGIAPDSNEQGRPRSAATVARDAYTKLSACEQHYADGVVYENDRGSPDSLEVISAFIDGVDVRAGEAAWAEYRRRDEVVFFQNFFEYADRVRPWHRTTATPEYELHRVCSNVEFVPNGSQDVCKKDDRLLDMLLEGKGDWDFDFLSEAEVAVEMRFYCCVPLGLLGASPAAPPVGGLFGRGGGGGGLFGGGGGSGGLFGGGGGSGGLFGGAGIFAEPAGRNVHNGGGGLFGGGR